MADQILTIAYVNIRGQTGLPSTKQIQIENFIRREKIDIVHFQEIHITEDSFSSCPLISSSFNIVANNSPTKYGTATLTRSDLTAENIQFDTGGRAIVFDLGPLTLANLYPASGTDSNSKKAREQLFSDTLPQLLLHRQDTGVIGGDMNCILDKQDCTHNPASKLSPCLARFLKMSNMSDCFRSLHPNANIFSHFYHSAQLGEGASRLDRAYSWGEVTMVAAKYEPLAFSDHMAHVITISLPSTFSRILSPRARPTFKIRPEVIRDDEFKKNLGEAMADWLIVKGRGMEVLDWWEFVVKPGVRKLAIKRSKEINQERRGLLNLLMLRQSYLSRRMQCGERHRLGELKDVHNQIQDWYQQEGEKLLLQTRNDEFNLNERTRLYHHELHKKQLKKTSILQLQTEHGLIEGHSACAEYLEKQVEDLLLQRHPLDVGARETLLSEMQAKVFNETDNEKLLTLPTAREVKEVVSNSNQLAAPGTDGIPSLLYSACWETMGSALTEVVQAIHAGGRPTKSMRTSMMVFGAKPKKPNSIKPGDKRRISLLNADFKVVTGIEAKRFGKTATHSLSPIQLVAGEDRRIHHGINLARDAIQAVGRNQDGCGLLDLDFMAGFDWLDMEWVYVVLEHIGVQEKIVERIKRLYGDSYSIVVVNNVMGKSVPNDRGSLRQGDIPSMFWFGVGIDPLLIYLDRRLKGIQISSLPILGPTQEHSLSPVLPPLTQHYKVVAYADDVKPAITSMHEFDMVDTACKLLERAAGVKLHRDPASEKVKFLPLGRWRGTLSQEDLPNHCQYITLSDHLDFVGVELRATFAKTRKVNGDQLVSRIKNTLGPWKSGKFMPLTMRPFSANTYALSKVWFKCSSINLRVCDYTAITSQVKQWMYQDMFYKPSELVLYRECSQGGLGLMCVRIRALALLVRSFLETAANPKFRHQLLHETLYRYHVLGETSLPNPGFLPYYDKEFFSLLQHYKENCPLNITVLSTRQWYRLLLEDKVLMTPAQENSPATLLPVRAESLHPHIDWTLSWSLVRMRGLTSNMSSFLFKLLHLLLPTQSEVHRLGADRESTAGLCSLCKAEQEDLDHAFFTCPSSLEAGLATLGWAQQVVPNITGDMALRLELSGDTDDNQRLAATTIIAVGLSFIWEARVNKKKVERYEVRAELEAVVSLMRRTRKKEAGDLILHAMSQ